MLERRCHHIRSHRDGAFRGWVDLVVGRCAESIGV